MFRWFCVLLLLAGNVSAWSIEDGGSDVEPGGLANHADLRSLEVEESAEAFEMRLRVASGEIATAESQNVLHHVTFLVGEVPFRVSVRSFFYAYNVDIGFQVEGGVLQREADGIWSMVARLDPQALDEPGWSVEVPRHLLVDETGRTPAKGHDLRHLWVLGETGDFETEGAPRLQDRMPDDGDVTMPVELGLVQEGSLRLVSDDPMRASNGEATTYRFQVLASNQGEAGTFSFTATDVPPGFEVGLPDDLALDAGAQRMVNVTLQVPFAHQHGKDETFVLELHGPDGVGRIALGVHYLRIAQPAGHHDTLYLHAQDRSSLSNSFGTHGAWALVQGVEASRILTMNTLLDDELDDGGAVWGRAAGVGVVETASVPNEEYRWVVPLRPGLAMGVAQDLDRDGAVSFTASSMLDGAGAELNGTLVVVHDENRTVLGHIPAIKIDDLAEGALFEGPYVPERAIVDRVPGQQLVLELFMAVERPGGVPGSLLPPVGLMSGSSIRLPLLEYHEVVTAEPASEATPDVEAKPAAKEDAPAPFGLLALLVVAFVLRRR